MAVRAMCALIWLGAVPVVLGQSSTDWSDYIAGPQQRLVSPASVAWVTGGGGSVIGSSSALVEDGQSARLSRPTGSSFPKLAIDFGLPVSGKIEIVFGGTVTSSLSIAFSQRLEFLDVGSDTSSFELGDITAHGQSGVTWRTDLRRGFRYVLLYLPSIGMVDVDAVRVYHTPMLATPETYDGHFLCDNDLLNRIWYGCVYTQEICTTSGNDVDGPWEIEDGMLSISFEGDKYVPGGPFGLTVPGTDWTDYVFEFDFRIMPLGSNCGWAFRAQDGANSYLWKIETGPTANDPGTLWKTWYANGVQAAGTRITLPQPVHEDELHHVRMEVEGNVFQTYLDGALIDTHIDTASRFTQGRVGFYSNEADDEHFHVDNVTVSDAAGALFGDDFDGRFLVADWNLWERAELLTINDGAKRDRVWVWGDFYPSQRTMFTAHWEPQIIAETMRDGVAHQYGQAIQNQYGGYLRGKIPAANASGNNYMAGDSWSAKWLDDYTFWWVLTLHHYWLYTGDDAFVQEVFPALLGVMDDWCQRKMLHGGLIDLQQGDWYWSMLRTGAVTSFNALYVRSLQCAADMAEAIGQTADAAGWRVRAVDVAAEVNARLLSPFQNLYYDGLNDTSHFPLDANTLTIIYDIADDALVPHILGEIKQRMWSPIGTKSSSPGYETWGHQDQVWAWYVQFEVEARFQHHDDLNAFEAIRRPWGLMVDGDPGRTMWEFIVSDGGTESGLRNTDHAFSSGAAWLMTEYVAGIRPTSPGFATFDIIPHPGELTWVQCTAPTPHGGIGIEYAIDPLVKSFNATVTVPVNTLGRVAVPWLGSVAIIELDGEMVWTPAGSAGDATSDQHHIYIPGVSPGEHQLAALFDPGIIAPDFDYDGDVDMQDFGHMQACLTGAGIVMEDPACLNARLDTDADIDEADMAVFRGCLTGANIPSDVECLR